MRLTSCWNRIFQCVFVAVFCVAISNSRAEIDYRLFFNMARINSGWQYDSAMARMRSAASVGYNGMVLVDHALHDLEDQSQTYFDRIENMKAVARQLKFGVIPSYNSALSPSETDHNLAETFPVRGTRFKAIGGTAKAVGDHPTSINNPGFEGSTGGWKMNYLMSAGSIDYSNKKSGSSSFKVVNAPGRSSISQSMQVKPFRAYTLSAWIKTSGVAQTRDVGFKVEAGGRPLLWRRDIIYRTPKKFNPVGSTMNWKRFVIDFNSLTNTNVRLHFAFTGLSKNSGTIWVDDVQMAEVGLYETVRRPSNPIVVRSLDKSTTYEEGKDYIIDPKCSNFTNTSYNYQGTMQIPAGSRISNGQELIVDWFQYSNVETCVPNADFCLPKTWAQIDDDIRRIDDLFGYGHTFVKLDEWRVANWNPNCQLISATTTGEYMAKKMTMIQDRLLKINPKRQIYSWNDMFDPYHNAVSNYYMVNGTVAGSWQGLHNSTMIANWMTNDVVKSPKSLRFFFGMDPKYPNVKNPQIFSVTGAGVLQAVVPRARQIEAENPNAKMDGFILNVWDGNYNDIGRTASAAKQLGFWGAGPLPTDVGIEKAPPAVNGAVPGRVHISGTGNIRKISYHTEHVCKVGLKVVDLQGRLVNKQEESIRFAGSRQMQWDTSNLTSGVYMLELSQNGVQHRVVKQLVF